MKNVLWALLCILTLTSHAMEIKINRVKIHYLPVARFVFDQDGIYAIGQYERYLGKQYSIMVSGHYWVPVERSNYQYHFVGIGPKRYFKNEFSGWSLGLQPSYNLIDDGSREDRFAILGLAGYTWQWKFVNTNFELGLGPSFRHESEKWTFENMALSYIMLGANF